MKNKIKKTNKIPKKKSQKNLGVKSNNKMTMKLSKIITIFLMIFVIIQPIMDTLTYLQTRYNFNLLSISSLFRTITFGLIILYLLLDKDKRKNIWFLLIYFLIYLGCQVFWLSNGLSSSLNTLLTIFYLPVIIIFMNKAAIDKKYFNLKIIMITYLIYLNLIIIPYLFKYGNYANNFYEGKNGFYGLFYGGNEISNILVIMLPLVIEYLVRKKSYFLIILTFIELLLCIYLVGTKTLILGSIIVSIYFLIKYLRPAYKKLDSKKKYLIWTFLVLLVIGSILILPKMAVTKNIIRAINYYGFNLSNIFSLNGLDKLVFSGRLEILNKVNNLYLHSPLINILMGLGKSYVNAFKGIEIDIFDIFFSIGIIGILIYGYLCFKNIKDTKLKGIYLFTLVLSIMISLVTGHVLNMPNVSIYVGLLFVLNKQEE